jgi:hypothetical protein
MPFPGIIAAHPLAFYLLFWVVYKDVMNVSGRYSEVGWNDHLP